MEKSYLVVEKDSIVTYVGPDATHLFKAQSLKFSIGLWLKTGMKPTRGVGITRMLALCKEFTGKTYKRTEGSLALQDLNAWIGNMRSALPVFPISGCSDISSEEGE